jgi:Domain of unknown function (DUF4198)
MNRTIKHAAFALALCLPLAAQAHKAWLLPSSTVLSADQWITVDAAVSNDLFYFNHVPMRLDNLVITGPDGAPVAAENRATGQLRSTFDLHLTGNGTYRLAIVNNGLFANYEIDGAPQRWRGTAETFAKEIPANAKNLVVSQALSRLETFVTSGTPNQTALKPTGVGLELIPITHPNDLFAGESASFRLQLDGKPAANLNAQIIPGGSRYRDEQAAIALTTDADGKLTVTWPQPGMYWLEATVQDDKASLKQAQQRRVSYVATFEVLAP